MATTDGIWVPSSGPIGKLTQLFSTFAASVASAIAASMTPSGSIIAFGGATAPSGYLICDGAQYNTADYPDLFQAIGYAFGGSGASFRVPNLKGRTLVGRDSAQTEFDTLGETGGEKTHKLTVAEMPSHTHTWQTDASGGGGAVGWGGIASALRPNTVNYTTKPNTGATGGDGAHNNLQPYAVVNYLIKT